MRRGQLLGSKGREFYEGPEMYDEDVEDFGSCCRIILLAIRVPGI
jgi:hypothetical protein